MTGIDSIGSRTEESNKIEPDAPWLWLGAGWRDLWRAPEVSLAYGLIFAAVSGLLTWSLFRLDLQYMLLPMAAGFMLVGPMLAVGLYEISRRIETGEPVTLRTALFVAARSPTQLAFLGALLMLMLLAWVRVAQLIYALFFGLTAFPGFEESITQVFFTAEGLGMLAIGTAVGGAIATAVFAAAVFAVPMLLVRDKDAISAMLESIAAVRRNPWPLLVWGWLVVVLIAVGIATLYIGLIVTFPLVGHATWHAYRHVIDGVAPQPGHEPGS
ncbi:MAG: DUF2189 domain-containing protein [Alphaproteobacteria bacterium]|nr:DUF2189 domain-containing protein [Alphaproteobacteria bacterium]